MRNFSNKLLKEFKKNPTYWVGAIIFLSLFLRLGGSLLINNIISFFIVTFLLQMGFNDWEKAAIYAAIIIVAINVVHYFGYTQEGFDNLDEALKKLEALGNSEHTEEDTENKEAKEKDIDVKDNPDTVNKKEDKKAVPVVTLSGKKQSVEEYNQWGDEEVAKVYKGLGKKDVKRPAANAQRDLYQLIDTVKQLQSTVDELGPTLKEGKKIMDAFENIKIE